ncbi:MAG: class I SAM-dependent methyltransferase [Ginsengibacter sp.]
MNKIKRFFARNFIPFLRFKNIRFWFVKKRYSLLKKNMRFKKDGSNSIGEKTIEHNLSAFNSDAAFGCGERMGLLIYPVIAFYNYYTIDKSRKQVLIVGCRTEDDIYWMKSYGFTQTFGFDLFSYSPSVLIGDIHKTDFEEERFDVVLIAWMISYSSDPETVIKECRRILKPGGLLGIGIDHNPNQDYNNIKAPRVNTLNTSQELISLLNSTINHKVLFEYDHYNIKDNDHSTTVISICK